MDAKDAPDVAGLRPSGFRIQAQKYGSALRVATGKEISGVFFA